MRVWTRMLTVGASMAAIGMLSIAFGQSQRDEDPEAVIERRLAQLELDLANLNSIVRMRTDIGAGAGDRATRDLNVENRFREIERQLQQLSFTISDLQRQASDAVRIASQAQSDAQFAQQIARDAQSRVQ